MTELKWHTEKRRLGELLPLEKNPFGRIDAKKKKRLEEKILSLGVFETPTVDTENVLLTFNKRHHILLELGRADEQIDVMVPSRKLSEKERKEIILSSNVHEGDWIAEILQEEFSDIDLIDLGIDFKVMDELLEESVKQSKKSKETEPPVYPIVPEFSEKHEAFVIVCDNEIDSNFIAQVLGIGTMQSYKCEAVGSSHVIAAKDFIERWNSKEVK